MIRIPFSLEKLDEFADEHYKLLLNKFDLEKNFKAAKKGKLAKLFLQIDKNWPAVIKGRPAKLEELMVDLEVISDEIKADYGASKPKLTAAEVKEWFNNEVFKVFNYNKTSGFTKKSDGKYAYEHSAKLGLDTCPYCNVQFTYTMKSKSGKARPQFDHFIGKSDHPYFAVSFYNLVPSCYFCNSSLKGSKPFRISTHIHPFIDDFGTYCDFRTGIKSVDFMVDKKDFEIGIVFRDGVKTADEDRVKKSEEDLSILKRYRFHKDYAGEMIYRAHIYSESKVEEILEEWEYEGHRIFKDKQEIKDLVVGKFLSVGSNHKRILSKLSKDIGEEFGLVF